MSPVKRDRRLLKRLPSLLTQAQTTDFLQKLGCAGLRVAGVKSLLGKAELALEVVNYIHNKMVVLTEADEMLVKLENRFLGRFSFFGPADWTRFYGQAPIDDEKLPMSIDKLLDFLNSSCPIFFSDKARVGDTHSLVYLPELFDEHPLTYEALTEIDGEFLCSDSMIHDGEMVLKDQLSMGKLLVLKEGSWPFIETPRFRWYLVLNRLVDPSSETGNIAWTSGYAVPSPVEWCAANIVLLRKYGKLVSDDGGKWGQTSQDVQICRGLVTSEMITLAKVEPSHSIGSIFVRCLG